MKSNEESTRHWEVGRLIGYARGEFSPLESALYAAHAAASALNDPRAQEIRWALDAIKHAREHLWKPPMGGD